MKWASLLAATIPGPVPGLNVTSTTLIGAGNAASLFPEITPAPAPSPAAGSTAPGAGRSTSPAGQIADASATAPGTPEQAGQVLGLIALGLAFLLATTRLSQRRRTKKRGPGT